MSPAPRHITSVVTSVSPSPQFLPLAGHAVQPGWPPVDTSLCVTSLCVTRASPSPQFLPLAGHAVQQAGRLLTLVCVSPKRPPHLSFSLWPATLSSRPAACWLWPSLSVSRPTQPCMRSVLAVRSFSCVRLRASCSVSCCCSEQSRSGDWTIAASSDAHFSCADSSATFWSASTPPRQLRLTIGFMIYVSI